MTRPNPPPIQRDWVTKSHRHAARLRLALSVSGLFVRSPVPTCVSPSKDSWPCGMLAPVCLEPGRQLLSSGLRAWLWFGGTNPLGKLAGYWSSSLRYPEAETHAVRRLHPHLQVRSTI